MSAFEELGVCPEIIKAVEEDDWLLPTPIQAESIPLILGGGDVCAAAETGSGKTGAFGLPALQIVHESLRAAAQAAVVSMKPVVFCGERDAGSVERTAREFLGDRSVSTSLFRLVRLVSFPASRGCTLDEAARDLQICLGDGERCSCADSRGWRGVRGTAPVLAGKYMYEVEILSPGLVRVGWGTRLGKLEIGKDENSFGYGGTGKKSWNGRFEDYGVQFGAGDVVGCLLDRSNPDRGTVSFAVNGRLLGEAFVLPPALRNSALLPAICGKDFDARCRFARLEFPVEGFAPVANLKACDDARCLAGETPGKSSAGVQCLILEPTRDLALQTFNCLKKIGRYLEAPSIRVALCCGGDEREQRGEMAKGPHIVVGTLQKVSSCIHRGVLSVKSLKLLILDEADELVKFDALSEILKIKRAASVGSSRRMQVSLFSATLHTDDVRRAVEALTERPTWVDLKGKVTIPDTVHALICPVFAHEGMPFKSASLGRVEPKTDGIHAPSAALPRHSEQFASQRVKEIKPHLVVALADAFKMETCLVFCRTNLDCDNLELFLTSCGGGRKFAGKAESGKENPYSCVVLAGMRSQEERNRNLAHFKAGDVRFLICTDVAARGIDIHELPFLIMTTLPDDPDLFFHRVGRVGRADRMGLAICLAATSPEQMWFHRCANRGQGCRNTRLVKEGGCTIWYDETACLKAIEDRVGGPLPRMDAGNFSCPGIVDPLGVLGDSAGDNIRKRRPGASSETGEGATRRDASGAPGPVVYGKARNDQNLLSTMKHLQEISGAVSELEILEREMQKQFVTLAARGI